MRALVWHGKQDIRCDSVPDPRIEQPRDAIIRVTSCAICGSDLHLYDGFMPGMKSGDIMGHETMGGWSRSGRSCNTLKKGDRVVIPFTIFCGECDQCRRGNFSRLRAVQPQQGHGRQGLRPHHRRPVRLYPPDRRLCRRPGRVPAGALRRQDPHQGAQRPFRRAGAVPVGHLPDRLAGRGAMRHRAHRHRGDLGLRPGRPDGDPQRRPARRQAGHRHRQRAGTPVHGPGRRRDHAELRRGQHRRAAERADPRQGAGEVHRCRGHGSACDGDARSACTTAPSRR